ncbi:MAG: PEGA domain-containing protein, partial [Kiritimatiellae bacterium]|nr:PEGA domain-containing protein [Kiritimatiellia bacterium]
RVPGLLAVAFSANVAGANVRVDGVSHGTIGSEPVLIKLSPGLHNLEIAYPGLVGFKDRVKIREGITFAVTLGLTPEGAVARRRDALFGQLMDRLEKSGATDDLVRELVARGYAQYLTASHAQLDGMPQSLVLENSPGAVLGLPAVGMEMPAGPSTERLFERGGELAK